MASSTSWIGAESNVGRHVDPLDDPEFEDLPEKFDGAQPPAERLAIVSLVAGIVGFFLPVVGPVTAVVSGHIARDEIRKSKGRLGGDGLARTGLVLGYLWIGLSALMVAGLIFVFAVSVGEISRAERSSSGSRATGTIRISPAPPPPPPSPEARIWGSFGQSISPIERADWIGRGDDRAERADEFRILIRPIEVEHVRVPSLRIVRPAMPPPIPRAPAMPGPPSASPEGCEAI
jgi:hypothetical protein